MNQRGDTIVEVIFAITIFSLVAVGGLAIMNQGTATAQRSLEISLVRDHMDAQADALRYLHDAYIASIASSGSSSTSPAQSIWTAITAGASASKAQSLIELSQGQVCNLPGPGGSQGSQAFALDIRKLESVSGAVLPQAQINVNPATYAQIRYSGASASSEGVWIQAVHQARGTTLPGYYDFHIRACWYPTGQTVPMTLGTIVRLYDPKA